MTTFGYAEMRDWAEQSDDPRVRSMWERLSNCRSKIAKWCQAAEYAELRTKNLAAENAALRAEVERLDSQLNNCLEYEKCVRDASFEYARKVLPTHVLDTHFGIEPDVDDVCGMLSAEVEHLREERRWRSTKTEQPSDDQWQVLIYDGRNVDIGDKLDGVGWTQEFGTLEWENVTHWQPLPAPPDK